MRADREDGHRQLISGARNNKAICVLVISVLLVGSLALYLPEWRREAGPGNFAPGRKDSVVAQARVPTERQVGQVAARAVAEQPQRTAEMQFWEQVDRDRKQTSPTELREHKREAAGRQTSFSDYNYTPPKNVNTIKSVAVKPTGRSSSSSQHTLTGSKSASVHWADARGKVSRWRTSFDFQNSHIDNSTFCLNVGKGSIPYRECRKGAQQWLKDQCRTDNNIHEEWRRMYCQAHRSYRT